jgi:hypothetical protein
MIRMKVLPSEEVRVTFSLDRDEPSGPTSVVGDFNEWNPSMHPLRSRSNGKRSAVVVLPVGSSVSFRYLSDGGVWSDDPAVDERDEYGNNRLTV